MPQQTVIVVAGGERDIDAVPIDTTGTLVIGADSGVDFALALGLHVDVAIGDFDSVSSEGLERVQADGARIESHPSAKDQTDLELALREAVRLGATDILVLGVAGGRLDHLMANFLLLASPELAPCRIRAVAGSARIHIARGGEPATDLPAEVGELLTLLAVGGPASGLTTHGLLYRLDGESLLPGTSLGVSNVVESTPASVELEDGTLLAIFPGR